MGHRVKNQRSEVGSRKSDVGGSGVRDQMILEAHSSRLTAHRKSVIQNRRSEESE